VRRFFETTGAGGGFWAWKKAGEKGWVKLELVKVDAVSLSRD